MAVLTYKQFQQWKQDQYIKQDGKCQICGGDLDSWNSAHGDHSHTNGFMRGLLCRGCNTYIEGKIQGLFYRAGHKDKNWSDVLRNLADYWQVDYSTNPIHPTFINDESKKFAKLTREVMIKRLNAAGGEYDKTYSKEMLIDEFKKNYREILTP